MDNLRYINKQSAEVDKTHTVDDAVSDFMKSHGTEPFDHVIILAVRDEGDGMMDHYGSRMKSEKMMWFLENMKAILLGR